MAKTCLKLAKPKPKQSQDEAIPGFSILAHFLSASLREFPCNSDDGDTALEVAPIGRSRSMTG